VTFPVAPFGYIQDSATIRPVRDEYADDQYNIGYRGDATPDDSASLHMRPKWIAHAFAAGQFPPAPVPTPRA
jgi:hypothetical protein